MSKEREALHRIMHSVAAYDGANWTTIEPGGGLARRTLFLAAKALGLTEYDLYNGRCIEGCDRGDRRKAVSVYDGL